MNPTIDDIHPEALAQMGERGGTWGIYENHDIGHPECGHLTFLRFGEGCTFETPPKTHPDGPDGAIMWRYQLIGTLDAEQGTINPFNHA